jgi:hypothetical protein
LTCHPHRVSQHLFTERLSSPLSRATSKYIALVISSSSRQLSCVISCSFRQIPPRSSLPSSSDMHTHTSSPALPAQLPLYTSTSVQTLLLTQSPFFSPLFSACYTMRCTQDVFDWSECDPNRCSSPDAFFGTDCYAGSDTEQCTCTFGYSAKETGETIWYQNEQYYKYTCCPPQASSDGEDCGDYSPLGSLISLIVGCTFAGCCCCGLIGAAVFFMCAAQKKNNVNAEQANAMQMQPPMYTPSVKDSVNPYA